jgi:hypothetical protein
LSCLAAVLLAGLLGCGRHGLGVVPSHGSDAAAVVSDAIAADVSSGPVDSGGSETGTDMVTGNLEAGAASQKDASTTMGTQFDAGLPDARVVDLAGRTDGRVDPSADSNARTDANIDAGVPDAGVADGGVPDAPADAPQVPDATSSPDAEPNLDACVPLACRNYTSCVAEYCGTIGDGCGGTLNCPTTCQGYGWVCEDGVCKAGMPQCMPLSCTTASGNHYCGDIDIYDGCGGTVHCGACPEPGWICQNNICIGPPSVCTRRPCDVLVYGVESCGIICDNECGGTRDCGACKESDWICWGNRCLGPPSCQSLTCNPAGGEYCGAIGDGCGGTIDCGRQCSDGSTCGERVPGVCGSSTDVPAPPIAPPPPAPGRACPLPPLPACPPPFPPPQPL